MVSDMYSSFYYSRRALKRRVCHSFLAASRGSNAELRPKVNNLHTTPRYNLKWIARSLDTSAGTAGFQCTLHRPSRLNDLV